MSTWDAARIAQRRPLPKRVVPKPVGPTALLRPADGMNWVDAIREVGDNPDYPSNVRLCDTHRCCGYHVCSCPPLRTGERG